MAVAVLVGLGACSGSASSTTGAGSVTGGAWAAGVFQPSSRFINQCQAPRSGNDPYTGRPFPDLPGSSVDEKSFLRSWTNELYLWYDEVPDVDPADTVYNGQSIAAAVDYFGILKTTAITAAGADKDKFHFTEPTAAYEASSQGGVNVGYGINWALLQPYPPRLVYIADVWPGTAAATSGLVRGDEVLDIDGVDMVNGNDTTTLNAGLSPSKSGESHAFTVKDPVTGLTRTVTLQAATVTETPVPVVRTITTATGTVGYLLFNDHIATAEQELIAGISQLRSAAVTDLVLDIRYNGGGYLDIASELAYMIAGPGPTAGEPFDQIAFNAKYPSTNPVTSQPLAATPFHTTSQGFSGPAGVALPYLGLSRVYVLTGSDTCSASEAIMNGLRGVNVEVIQVGSTTCGKPYGFYPQDNCGTTYFSIQFQSNNAQGFGAYSDGFTPVNATTPIDPGTGLPGCSVTDDFTHALGDPAEGRLAAALAYRAGASCPSPSGVAPQKLGVARLRVHRAPLRENLFLRH